MFVSRLCVFFGELSVQVSWPLFDWADCFSVTELYELLVCFGRNPLSVSFVQAVRLCSFFLLVSAFNGTVEPVFCIGFVLGVICVCILVGGGEFWGFFPRCVRPYVSGVPGNPGCRWLHLCSCPACCSGEVSLP